ncbi:hypothetical protein ACRPMK_08395 [Streptococcus uberis]|uniref:hypothetical protein n=1 Tax=Streptococcus uberis TaxID=1349 RepID=UPI001C96FA68|nr:hypothetical protein [Streptococcus uberis]MBY4765051.1 hypothetical protein [Streptococcus uberis]MCR4253109.1 hypothetical protein [Streptococcus uberis]MCR4254924.1 hypothetical protein [Streptococcus uberis]MCR4259457.1 hypothetical protein [Streptococcus uberis]MCR4262072.1 hypothetical protein [Streptococcus uberis]
MIKQKNNICLLLVIVSSLMIYNNVHADSIFNPKPSNLIIKHVAHDPGDKYNRWEYRYTAQPYDFYFNPFTGSWKMLQVTSNTNHLVQTIFDGWAKSGPWVPRRFQ